MAIEGDYSWTFEIHEVLKRLGGVEGVEAAWRGVKEWSRGYGRCVMEVRENLEGQNTSSQEVTRQAASPISNISH
jgi:hypothetical protein